MVINDLQNNRPFSITKDASNNGNIKTFPLLVRYFKKQKDLNIKPLSFYESDSELSGNMAHFIKLKLRD